MRMDWLERKMAKHETEAVRILTLKLVNTVARHTCVRAFVVAVLHERDRGINRTLDVVSSEMIDADNRVSMGMRCWEVAPVIRS